MDKRADVFDTREFQKPMPKGSRQALRGLICFLFACVLLVAALIGVLGGAVFFASNQVSEPTAPVALLPGNAKARPAFSLGAAQAAVVPLCVASGDSYTVGTGVVITEDGYVLTCDHLFEGHKAATIRATLSDGTVTACAYVGGDDRLDVAVLKMEQRQMACLPLDPSVSTAAGCAVAAIGCPESVVSAPVVTAGVISATSVRVATAGDYPQRRLQTDAPVSPGFSGGALVSEEGSFLGMIQAKDISSGTEGVAYALPVAAIASIVDELIQNGCLTRRVRCGMSLTYVSPIVAAATGQPSGLKIVALASDSVLAAQGFHPGDVIHAVNGNTLTSLDGFFDRLEEAGEGDTLLLTIARTDGAERQVSLPVTWERGSNAYRS